MDLLATFGFHHTPFTRELGPNDRFVLPHQEETVEALLHATRHRMSAALIGPAGSGKTVCIRALLAQLPEARYQAHYVKVTSLSKRDMCREIAAACGLPPTGTYPALVRRLQDGFLSLADTDGIRPVLVLDEAHDLRPDVLAMLRILTNFAMDSRLVLSVILAGQPPLRQMLARDDQQAVARRLAHYATLRLLSRDEARAYVAHRCRVAGADADPFDGDAHDALFEMSRGNLRALNHLARKALEIAARAGVTAVSHNEISEARQQLWP